MEKLVHGCIALKMFPTLSFLKMLSFFQAPYKFDFLSITSVDNMKTTIKMNHGFLK